MIKMIAVDVDGTFLDDKYTYNEARFDELFSQLLDQGIHFVIASGNNIPQLKKLMPHHHEHISYIGNNGAQVYSKGKEISNHSIDHELLKEAITAALEIEGARLLLAGEKATYLHDTEPEAVIKQLQKIMSPLVTVSNFLDLKEEHYYKIGVYTKDQADQTIIDILNEKLNSKLHATSSGHGNVDLINHQTHKAAGLEKLAQHYDIDPSEIAAFGDNLNDIEMLEYVGYSYAMANAKPQVKEVARYIAPSNNEEGVLSSIEGILKRNRK